MSGEARTIGVLLAGNYGPAVGYAWNNIYQLFNAIARACHERGARVCLSFTEMDGPVGFIDKDLPFETLSFDWQKPSLSSLLELRRAIRHFGIRHLYLTDQPMARCLYVLMRLWGIRRIVVHCRVSVSNPRPAPAARGVRGLIKKLIHRLPWYAADHAYAVSNFVSNRLVAAHCFPGGRVQTIHNGIEVERWNFESRPQGSSPVIFFAASRAARYKGILVLIEAAAQLRSRHGLDDFVVRYAGHGPDIELFISRARELDLRDHVVFLGKLDNTRDETRGADVLVVPSMYGDACPSTVSESLASGRPLITTAAGGIPELVGDPRNAIVVAPGDVTALADAMAELVRNPAKRLEIGRLGHQRAATALGQAEYHAKVIAAIVADFDLAAAASGRRHAPAENPSASH